MGRERQTVVTIHDRADVRVGGHDPPTRRVYAGFTSPAPLSLPPCAWSSSRLAGRLAKFSLPGGPEKAFPCMRRATRGGWGWGRARKSFSTGRAAPGKAFPPRSGEAEKSSLAALISFFAVSVYAGSAWAGSSPASMRVRWLSRGRPPYGVRSPGIVWISDPFPHRGRIIVNPRIYMMQKKL